jgi:hypothetical protein
MLCKSALIELDEQLLVLQSLEDQLQMINMIFHSFTKDKDVIHKYQDKLPHIHCKNRIHEALKSCRGIAQPKWHDSKLEVSMVSLKCCLCFILRNHSNLMEP